MEAAGRLISLGYDIEQGGRKGVHFGSCQEGHRVASTSLAMEVGKQLQGPRVASEEQGGSPEWQGNCAQAFGSCLRGKEREKKENRNEYQSMH